MTSRKPNVLRKIALQQLSQCFGDLSSATKEELATSLVRQWLTYDGAAGLFTHGHDFWFAMTRTSYGGAQVVREVQKGAIAEQMRRSRVIEDDFPDLLHELNVCQSVRCNTDYGERLQLRIDPALRRFYVELIPDQEE